MKHTCTKSGWGDVWVGGCGLTQTLRLTQTDDIVNLLNGVCCTDLACCIYNNQSAVLFWNWSREYVSHCDQQIMRDRTQTCAHVEACTDERTCRCSITEKSEFIIPRSTKHFHRHKRLLIKSHICTCHARGPTVDLYEDPVPYNVRADTSENLRNLERSEEEPHSTFSYLYYHSISRVVVCNCIRPQVCSNSSSVPKPVGKASEIMNTMAKVLAVALTMAILGRVASAAASQCANASTAGPVTQKVMIPISLTRFHRNRIEWNKSIAMPIGAG